LDDPVVPGAVLDATEMEALRGAARQEAADDARAEKEIGEVLGCLAECAPRPVVLKGRLLAAELWPHPSCRPSGDLDLLAEPDRVSAALSALAASGYRAVEWRRHRDTSSILCAAPEHRSLAVDLHWRPFQSVGWGLDPQRLLRRAHPATLAGHPVRTLDETDRLLY